MDTECSLKCPLCRINMQLWSSARRTLHLNACCEKAMSDCGYCPGCQKLLVNQAPRTHLKQCASRLNMTLIDFLTLSAATDPPRVHQAELKRFIPASCTAADGTTDEDMQTAVALSLSVIEQGRQRQLEAQLGARTHLADVGPPSHLLLSEKQRCVIFSDRLASIILQARRVKAQSCRGDRRYRKKCWSAPHLWNLASTLGENLRASDKESNTIPDELATSSNSPYYVDALVPPISPTSSRWGSNLLSLSQIPGRSATKQEQRHIRDEQMDMPSDIPFMQSQGFFCDSNSASPLRCASPQKKEQSPQSQNRSTAQTIHCFDSSSLPQNRFLTMLGQTTCSDGWLLLDTGESVPIHRFVFAAWDVLSIVFPDASDTAFAPGVSREQLMELLRCLYRGDAELFRQAMDNMDDSVKTLAKRWGLVPSLNLLSSQIENTNEGTTTDTARQPHSCSPSPTCSPHAIPISPDHSSVHPDSRAQSPVSEQWKSPETPLMVGACAPNISPQFSRDLFSPMDDYSYTTTAVPATTVVREMAEVADEERVQLSPRPNSPCESKNPTTSSVHPIFDEQPTPCPLLKRLRLSTDTSPSNKTSSSAPSLAVALASDGSPSLSPNGQSATFSSLFTPMSNSCCFEKENVFSPPENATFPANSTRTPLVERATPATCQTPVTPLPNYGQMMTPELKQALSTYGVRPLPRKRAVKLLNEIYNQLHQYEPTTRSDNFLEQKPLGTTGTNDHPISVSNGPQPADPVRKTAGAVPRGRPVSVTRPGTANSFVSAPVKTVKTSSGIVETGHPTEDHLSSVAEPSPFEVHDPSDDDADDDDDDRVHPVDLETAVLDFLQSNEQLYRNILAYTPIEFDVVHTMLKDSGCRISARKLMDVLDEQCITFTLRNRKQGRGKPRSTKVIRKRVAR